MAGMIATLPAVHFVCNILVSETPEVNNNSAFVFTQPPCNTQPLSLPRGYVAYPDVNAAYKFVDEEQVTAYVAKKRCARDNAHLAAIDTASKLRLIMGQMSTSDATHVGIYLMEEGGQWLSARTGLPVSSLPWSGIEPHGPGLCALIFASGSGLAKFPCSRTGNYVCEIPI